MKSVEIFTDGACSGNPGPGGWGAVLRYGTSEKELCEGEASTTNNRMELTAAIEALKALKEPCTVTLTSDSKYLTDAINLGWLSSWEKNGFKTAAKKPVKNPDLWQELSALLKKHEVTFIWVKGHAGHPENERCDKMAVSMIEKYRK